MSEVHHSIRDNIASDDVPVHEVQEDIRVSFWAEEGLGASILLCKKEWCWGSENMFHAGQSSTV